MEIKFNYSGVDTLYQCNDTRETFNEIFLKYYNDVDLNKITHLPYKIYNQ